jgi:signal transduction histidine kinase
MTLTQKRRARKVLDFVAKEARQTEAEALPSLLAVPALTLDARGRIVRCNALAAELLGPGGAGLAGRPLGEFLEYASGQKIRKSRSRSVQDLRASVVTGEAGPSRPIRQVSFGIPGSPLTLVLLLGDRERHEAVRAKERVLAERKTFLQSISHDLRAPLASVSGYVSILQRNESADDPAPDRKYFLDRLQALLVQMDEMLRHLVELSRVGAAKRASQRVHMVPLVRKVIERLAPKIIDIHAQVIVAPDLPDAWGDEIQLSRVFQNLVDNAVKFRSERPLRIEIAFVPGTHGGTFVVRDNGLGIAAALQPQIWEPFVKLDPSKPGSGVGLSLARRIVEEHGGRMWLESTAGEGSAFYVELPLAPVPRK